MIYLILASFIICGFYCFCIYKYRKYWLNEPEFITGKETYVSVSVVIAFRNEQENLPELVKSLQGQSVDRDKFEVILVNDNSDDDSVDILKKIVLNNENYHVVESFENGKKEAVKKGVESSKNDFIVTVDADCIVGKDWLKIICSFLSANEIDLLIGLVSCDYLKGWFNKFQYYEFVSLVFSAAGAAIGNNAIMCNGANLVFSKKLYNSAKNSLQNDLMSGDDIFLLQYAKANGYKVDILKSKGSVVTTGPVHSISDFFKQRIRWTSKSKKYSDVYTLTLAWLVFLSSIIQLLWPFIFFIDAKFAVIYGFLLITKFIVDYSLINAGSKYLGNKVSVVQMLSFFIVYPIYIVLTVLYAIVGTVKWKGRSV